MPGGQSGNTSHFQNRVHEHVTLLLQSSLAKPSTKLYQKVWKEMHRFHVLHYGKRAPLPVSTPTVMKFVAHLDLLGLAKATIRSYMSSIGYPHRLSGWVDPTAAVAVRKIIDASGTMSKKKPAKRPISLAMLRRLVTSTSHVFEGYKARLMGSIFALAFHACARVGELVLSNGNLSHVLKLDQVTMVKVQGKVTEIHVSFDTYKHSRPGQPGYRTILPISGPVCPIKLLLAYLEVRPKRSSDNRCPLFVWQSGEVVKSQEVCKALKTCLEHIGEDVAFYSPHGFRIGGATEAAKRGASDSELRMLGRWRSSAFLQYVRPQAFAFAYQ